jgi:ribosomal protein L24
MSIAEDQMRAANAARKEERRLAEMEHRIEMAKVRLLQDSPKDSRVYDFIERRKVHALQLRKNLGTQVLPKHRQLK